MALKGRGPVERLDRFRKARMIEAFLEDALACEIRDLKILDVGCGNGQISDHFSERNDVHSVDVTDKRRTDPARYSFTLIENETLPFGDGFFDVVLSHHVIEHVQDQRLHLAEIARVVKDPGVVYLGCPNGGSPFMAGHVGNPSVPTWPDIEALLEGAGFDREECYTRLLSEPDRYCCELRLGRLVPSAMIRLVRRWYPSHCFLLRRRVARGHFREACPSDDPAVVAAGLPERLARSR